MLSEDGSGKGAALVAAVACRIDQEKAAAARSSQKNCDVEMKNV